MSQAVYRRDDMSPNNWLSVIIQDDGDIIVGMYIAENENTGGTVFPSVEFCSIGAGGGRSPRTLRALKDLFDAIRHDNLEYPISDQPNDFLPKKRPKIVSIEEVEGVVEDMDYGYFSVNGFDLGKYEGKKVRLRIEVIE